MRTMAAAEFKAQCLAILDRVDPEGIVITKRGRPVAKLLPLGADSEDLIGSLAGKLAIKGDVLSTGVRWDAQP
jgi:prevent-host-death family protein